MSDIIVNSKQTRDLYKLQVDKWFEQDKYLTFKKPRIGRDRSLDQNALFHVWIKEMWSWSERKDKRDITEGQIEEMKDHVKSSFLSSHPECYPWIVLEYKNRKTGGKVKKFRSSAKYKTGEMFMVLEFMQAWSAQAGLILESRGEFEKRQRESVG